VSPYWAHERTVFADVGGRLQKSLDAGDTWTDVHKDLPDGHDSRHCRLA